MKHSTLRVAIMGASSGIGAATAIAFAREGAQLVLGARGKDGLEDIASRCRAAGGSAEIKAVDATDPDDVASFVKYARRTLGEIDLYFSNVGAGVVGKYAEVPLEDHHRVIETNLVSHMNDAYAVLPVFLEQNHGIFVNMISVGGLVASPYSAAYSASKFGLRGFSEALRAEVSKKKHIHICDVYPTFVDTPGFAHAANYTGAKLSYPPGVMAPEKVADAIVDLAWKPRDTTVVGAPASLLKLTQFAAPNLSASTMNRFLDAWSKRADRAEVTKGALYHPQKGASGVSSGEYGPSLRQAPQPQRNTALLAGAAVVAAAIGAQLLRKRT